MAKGTDLIFFTVQRCFSPRRTFWHTAVFFMDLPVSPFVLHTSVLTEKSVNLVLARDGFLYVAESLLIRISCRGYCSNREKFLICTAVYNAS